ncbi:PAS domain-containing protein [Rhodobacterales bacterium HKCCE3408]|nr:PAS domain-containing protein [Rhodobacterales bacterium HKCCE3408]
MSEDGTGEVGLLGIVGIGASAGGLEALSDFVEAIPARSGLCFVIVQHLAPDHPSIMDRLLSERTDLPVVRIEEGMAAQPDCIFVIPPGPSLTVSDGVFHLEPRDTRPGIRTPIDRFFTSLAEDMGEEAACVVLSGTGSDGTNGLRAIKARGGLAIVQDSDSARFAGMPESAFATGVVDFVLKPSRIAPCLVEVIRHRHHLEVVDGGQNLRSNVSERLPEIIGILAAETGHDFGAYKEGTLLRRLERRMIILRMSDVEELVEKLRTDETERTRLLQDFLIGVTQFFRDEAVFDTIADEIIPELLDRSQSGFRIWVPGCSTGEEAYSLAILFQERMRAENDHRPLQVFGTDVDLAALRLARAGRYAPSALAGMPSDLIERHFLAEEGHYTVKPSLRESVIFAPHNLLSDPPFSRIDLVSCRNLLIYLTQDGQRNVVSRFHYSLRNSGVLLLGPSETIGAHEDYFSVISRQHRLFRRDNSKSMGYSALTAQTRGSSGFGTRDPGAPAMPIAKPRPDANGPSVEEAADQFYLSRFSPPYLVIDANNRVLYVSANAGGLISPGKGELSADIESILARDLRAPARRLLSTLRDGAGSASETGIVVGGEDKPRIVDLSAAQLPGETGQIMLAIQPVRLESGQEPALPLPSTDTDTNATAARELELTRRTLATTQADFDLAEQELRSANEELWSMNEELQSSNEELETSREELQSINEELETINSELKENNRQLNVANADLRNFLESTDIPTIILGDGLKLRRYTRAARKLFSVDERDIGRPITDLSWKVDYPEIADDVASVQESLQVIERVVQNPETGARFVTRVRPYRGVDDRLQGSVITFVDDTERLAASLRLELSERRLAAAVTAGELGIYEYDPTTGRLDLDPRCRQIWGIADEGPVGLETLEDAFEREEDWIRFRDKLDPAGTASVGNRMHDEYRIAHVGSGAPVWIRDDSDIWVQDDGSRRVIGTMRDVTAQKTMTEEIRATAARLELTYEATGIAAYEWDATRDESKWTPNMYALLGCATDRPPSLALMTEFILPEDREKVQQIVDAALSSNELIETEFRIRRGTDGAIRTLAGKGRGIYDERGRPVGMIGINFDRTEEVAEEEYRRLLTNELNHRVKNSLATIQSIAQQSLRTAGSLDQFREKFMGRLQAISRAHDILVNGAREEATIQELVIAQVAPYAGEGAQRLSTSGPAITLGAASAHAIGLVLHELATNAAKYGALGSEGGRVSISWSETNLDGQAGLRLVWTESGGPPVSEPEDTGFGTRLIKTSLSLSLGGEAQIRYDPSGLIAEITCYQRTEDD